MKTPFRFNYSLGFLVVVLGVMLVGATDALPELPKQYQAQLKASRGSIRFGEKRIESLSDSLTPISILRLDTAGKDSLKLDLSSELYSAMRLSALDPQIREYFDFQEDGLVLEAKLKPEAAGKTDLQFQRFVRSADKGTIRSVESHLVKQTLLYRTENVIYVRFDEHGIYRAHCLESHAQIRWMGYTQAFTVQSHSRH
jgi:hypothetical protein